MRERRTALLLRIRKDLKGRLSNLAKREHRSLNQQIEFILEQFLRSGPKRISSATSEENVGKT
jgi:hypothetical protein